VTDSRAWIVQLDPPPGDGPRLAVKDAIDMDGLPTTVGCAAIADVARPAERDAPCVATARAAGARIVGKANLHELCYGGTGTNEWYGTPVNPLDPRRIPGGSSSGSAVAVATDEADVAFGTDTSGSVRTPAACCGVVGLKTTLRRIPTEGVWPLAPTLDTVGPLARDVGGVVLGMQLLEPGFAAAGPPAAAIGRLRVDGAEPAIDEAVDRLLADSEIEVVEVAADGWSDAQDAARVVLFGEAWESDAELYERAPSRIGANVRERLEEGRAIEPGRLAAARAAAGPWRAHLMSLLDRVEVLALPTLGALPPLLTEPGPETRGFNGPINLAGLPALALPAPLVAGGPLPASIQLVGRAGSEELLCATALVVEAAARTLG
jgi:amidase